jgi:Na+-driven multidrug efflux pump
VVAYNLGARSRERIRQSIQYALLYTAVFLGVCAAVLQIFTGPVVDIFSLGEEPRALCVLAVRSITWGYLFLGANLILQGVCQALGNGVYSLIVSALRYAVVVLPLAYAFSRTAIATTLVWWALPIAEAVGCAVAALLTRRLYRQRVMSLR